MIAPNSGEYCTFGRPGSPGRIVVDHHQMGESPEYRKASYFRLFDDQ